MVWAEDIEVELDALLATYADDLAVNEAESSVSMLLAPAAEQQPYVQLALQLHLNDQYPADAAPGITLQDARGLGSCRLAALQTHLDQEASQMLGEMMLGQLFESAKDWLDDNNWPEGACIFCLEDLTPNSSGSSGQQSSSQAAPGLPCMRLPCFHAFHQSCFSNWWCWQQQALREQQQQLEQRTGATAAAALMQEQLPAKEGVYFQLACPSCRATFPLQQHTQHMQQQLQEQRHSAGGACNNSSSGKLSAAELEPFRDIQQRHAALFTAQQQRHGIITDTNYSISDWDAAAAAAAAETAAAAAAASGRGSFLDHEASSSSSSSMNNVSTSRAQQRPSHNSSSNNTAPGRGSRGGRARGHHTSSSRSGRGGQQEPQQQQQQVGGKDGGHSSSRGTSSNRGSSSNRGRHAAEAADPEALAGAGSKQQQQQRWGSNQGGGRANALSGPGADSRGRGSRGRGPRQQQQQQQPHVQQA